MARHIDQIIQRLTAEFPSLRVQRVEAVDEADDEALWLIALPDRGTEVQIESIDGNGPFLIETAFSEARFRVRNAREAWSVVRTLLI